MKIRRNPALRALPLLLALLSAPVWSGESSKEPYPVTVLASVLFDVDGKAREFDVLDEAALPPQFLNGIKSRFVNARIPPQRDGATPATFRTGVRLEMLISPNESGGTVKIQGLHVEPLPLQRYFASYPDDIGKVGGWEGYVRAICTVGVTGACTAIQVEALPGMPDSVRRFAKSSLEKWVFEPQELNGQAVEGEYILSVQLNTIDSMPVDFRVPKFDRVLQGR